LTIILPIIVRNFQCSMPHCATGPRFNSRPEDTAVYSCRSILLCQISTLGTLYVGHK